MSMIIKPPEKYGWTIYCKDNCSFCDKVKELLINHYEPTSIHIINCSSYLVNDNTKNEFLQTMMQYCGREYRTFPMVFFNKSFIGGYSDTNLHIDTLRNLEIFSTHEYF